MIELWGRKNAYNVQKALWTLAELDLVFIHHDVGSTPGDLESPEFLALNPHARIPVISHSGVIVWESNSIVRYLAASFGAGNLWSEAPVERSFAERWMDWELAKLQVDFIDLFWRYYRTPEEAHDAVAIQSALQRCNEHFKQLDRQLAQQPYLAGDKFSMGDIPCAVCLYRYINMGLEVEQPQNVMQWYQRLAARDAFKRTVMVAFDELKGRTQF